MKFSANSQKSALAEINIIPLVDIMLVLLIIFMVTAPMLQEGLDINLPEVSAASVSVANEDTVLNITSDGVVYFNSNPKDQYSTVSIGDKLKELYANRPNKVIYLRADQGLRYGYVMEVMAACREAGVEKVGMITSPQKENESKKSARQ